MTVIKAIQLRGHHLLCLIGYRGMGYSAGFAENMSEVYQRLREEPDSEVTIIGGPDDLCACFPEDGVYHCDKESVANRDQTVLWRLGLQVGFTGPWSAILERIRSAIVPEDIDTICAGCPWRSYGVCAEGIRMVRRGERLPDLQADVPTTNRGEG